MPESIVLDDDAGTRYTPAATMRTIADLVDDAAAMAGALRQMIVRCGCGTAIPCRPCFDADRILARYDGSVQ